MKKVDITTILDRSGSMQNMTGQVIKSFNAFLLEQKAVDGEATISLIQFDHEYEVNYLAADIQEAQELNEDTYQPRGTTALLDAIGRTIVSIWKRLEDAEEAGDVVVVITTDGMENASREYSRGQIRDLIQHCEKSLGWKFIFLAADEASFQQHESFGMHPERSLRTGRGAAAFENATSLMSAKVQAFRSHDGLEEDLAFTEKEREEADGLDQS